MGKCTVLRLPLCFIIFVRVWLCVMSLNPLHLSNIEHSPAVFESDGKHEAVRHDPKTRTPRAEKEPAAPSTVAAATAASPFASDKMTSTPKAAPKLPRLPFRSPF